MRCFLFRILKKILKSLNIQPEDSVRNNHLESLHICWCSEQRGRSHIWELGPYGYVWICWISMDIYGYIWASSGTYPTCCTGLDIHLGYPYVSMHIHGFHAYPFISITDLQRYPHFISKNHISALSMLLSIKVSIHIHIPLCISMCIQVRSPS